MSPPANAYCARFELAVPSLETVLARGQPKLLHLLVIALLEHGGHMSLQAVAERLGALGVQTRTGDLEYSLLKAWHGLAPVYRGLDGSFGLDLDSWQLRHIVRETGLMPNKVAPRSKPPDPKLPGDDVPLTELELETAFCDQSLLGLSPLRQAAAVLDAHPKPMPPEEVEAYLAGLTTFRYRLAPETPRRWPGRLVSLDDSGRLVLDRGSPDLAAVRRAVRNLEAAALRKRVQRDQEARATERWRTE